MQCWVASHQNFTVCDRVRQRGRGKETGREGESAEVNSELMEREREALTDIGENCIKRWRWLELREVGRDEERGREEGRDSSGD